MAVIRTSQLKQGQVIDHDVKDRSGRVLLKAGTALDEKSIRIIKAWGVVEVSVEGVSSNEESPENSAREMNHINQSLERDLNHRFRFVNRSHPLIDELYRLCLKRSVSQAGGEQQ